MPVTTRSSTRAVAEKEKQAAKRKPKAPAKSAESKTPVKSSAKIQSGPAPGGFLVEWLTLKDLDATSEADEVQWVDILREMRQQPGCKIVARAHPQETRDVEWVTIEWKNSQSRDDFLSSPTSQRFTSAIASRLLTKETVWPFGPIGLVITADPHYPPQPLYEILVIYFRADLDASTMLSVNRTDGPFWMEDTEGPMSGLLCRDHGWMEGEVEYQGQSARRMVYFFTFKDEAAEQLYKEKICWKKMTRDGRIIMNAVETFFDDLEDLGMLGYKSQHGQFLEVMPFCMLEQDLFPRHERKLYIHCQDI